MEKTIKIDLRTEEQVNFPAGFVGENNHRSILVVPPIDLEKVSYYMLSFEIRGGVFRPEIEFVKPIKMLLPEQITSAPRVGLTLEGYNTDGTILGKSRQVWLTFRESSRGESLSFVGPPGPGVPPGGTEGQVLFKASHEDYDTKWEDPPGGESSLDGAFSFSFSAQDWAQGGGSELHIYIPSATHGMGVLPYVAAGYVFDGGTFLQGNFFPGISQSGDITLTTFERVSGKIIIKNY